MNLCAFTDLIQEAAVTYEKNLRVGSKHHENFKAEGKDASEEETLMLKDERHYQDVRS